VLAPSDSLPRALVRLSAKNPICREFPYAESLALGKDIFAESLSSPRVTVGKFRVCREPDRMLSANFKALGKSTVSRSAHYTGIYLVWARHTPGDLAWEAPRRGPNRVLRDLVQLLLSY